MKHFLQFFLAGLFLIPGFHSDSAINTINVERLRCEYRSNPMGIDVIQPHLSWVLQSEIRGQKQSSYQIIVASSRKKLIQNQGDLWDSGKVESRRSIHVVCQGKPLKSGMTCFWKVRVWDKDGKISSWSEPAIWEMALLNPGDWKGKWINDGKSNPSRDEDFYKDDPAPLFRREFNLSKEIRRARMYISGLGYYEAYLNGQRVGDHVLDPGFTMYSKRVYYSTYDVTEQLQKGDNCIGVILGNGWYNPLPLQMWGRFNLREHLTIGRPRLIAQLNIEFEDGTRQLIRSDENWKVTGGPIRFNNIYLGEVYDAQKEIPGWNQPGFNDSSWRYAVPAVETIGKLQAQPIPPIKVTDTMTPVNLTEPKPGVFIFDMGQNFSGWVSLSIEAPKGRKITMRYGELLNEDGTLNPMTSVCGQIKGKRKNKYGKEKNIGGPGSPEVAWQSDTYITKGIGREIYTPRFTFHGFRYVEVTGYPEEPTLDVMKGLRLSTAVKDTGSFSCSNEMINDIQKMCERTFLSNLFSIQSDCPHRERFAYGGDIAVTSDALILNYDMECFYSKTVRDWADSARKNGMLTDTAPFVGIQYCGVGWAMVHPLLLCRLYKYYGNQRIMREQYETARRWLDLVASQNPDHIIKKGLSDHEALTPTPAPPLVTPLYFQSACLLSKMARVLGKKTEAKKYEDLADEIKKKYIQKFLEPGTGKLAPFTQSSQSFALYLNMVPENERQAAIQFLLNKVLITHKGHLSTGIFGTKFLLDVLSREGYADVAYGMVNKKAFPSWGFMIENDATTVWEHWALSKNIYSHNHPMFGLVSQWFYNWLGGIQPHPEAVGFDRIIIKPQILKDLSWVKTSYQSVRGLIVSNWKRKDEYIQLNVEIPVNTTAKIYIPADRIETVEESLFVRVPATKAKGVLSSYMDGETAVFHVDSGKYQFLSKLPK